MKLAELYEEDDPLADITGAVPDAEPEDDSELRAAIEKIKADCKPFLRQYGGQLLFRGSRSISHGPTTMFSKRSVRTDRRPMNTDEGIHKQMDDWFNDKFGFRARSAAIFATGNFREARGYGTVYCVFPIGDFKFAWSPKIEDLFIQLKDEHESDIPGFLTSAGYKDTDLASAIDSNHEVMIQCKEYYLLLANTPEDRNKVLRMLDETE